ncbi:hypothetical protein E2320_011947 [Naja naja]|nr:hypothetical protein E2320_011947 [Naja naja]
MPLWVSACLATQHLLAFCGAKQSGRRACQDDGRKRVAPAGSCGNGRTELGSSRSCTPGCTARKQNVYSSIT